MASKDTGGTCSRASLCAPPRGTRPTAAGEAFYWAPGHVPVATEDCAYWDFSPTSEFMKVVEHIQRG